MPSRLAPFVCWIALTVLLAAHALRPVSAAVDVTVAGNQATAAIALGGIEADLILSFDDASGLSASALNISAQLVSLTDPTLLARLPSASLTTLPAALPLLITVEPPIGSTFSLRNTVRVEVHTHALPYTAGSQLRLFKAPLGGAFSDITDEIAPGSVRARGTTGGFSQFLILADLRSTSSVVNDKLGALQQRVAAAPALLAPGLQARLTQVSQALAQGRHADALAALEQFRAEVSAAAGSGLGNQWTPSHRQGNVAGDLLAGASSLRFSIGFLRDWGE